MTDVNKPFRRLLALAGVMLLGMLAALVAASPAAAHHTRVSGAAECQPDGTYEITWQVNNGSWENRYAQITKLVARPQRPIDGIKVGSAISADTDGDGPKGVVTGVQRVPGTTTSATLSVSAIWFERNGDRTGISSTDVGHAAGLKGTCKETPQCVGMAQATYKHTFDGAKGRATVELAGDLPLCQDQKQEFLLVSYFAPGIKKSWPQYAHDHDVAAIDAKHRKVELKVDVPKCYTQVDLVWGGKSDLITPLVEKGKRYGDKKLGSKGKPGNRSAGPLGAYRGGAVSCAQPKATFVPACDGSVAVHLSSGNYPVTFRVTATGVDRAVEVPAGKSVELPMPAGAGLIVVAERGKEVARYLWSRPSTCGLPTMSTESTCAELKVTITHPGQGMPPMEAVATYGTQENKVTASGGESETVVFTAGRGRVVNVVFPGYDYKLIGEYEDPGTCEKLPTTGAMTARIGLIGVLMVAVGAALVIFARRRRALTDEL
ncbi:cell wall anchor protein [Micromonospora sp. NPDC047548]|uniref:cell wall anchor protein n=1 Tax=Micromonospora sp. NPDC047548 TaxID=3155624 RepID=UPI0033C8F6FF